MSSEEIKQTIKDDFLEALEKRLRDKKDMNILTLFKLKQLVVERGTDQRLMIQVLEEIDDRIIKQELDGPKSLINTYKTRFGYTGFYIALISMVAVVSMNLLSRFSKK